MYKIHIDIDPLNETEWVFPCSFGHSKGSLGWDSSEWEFNCGRSLMHVNKPLREGDEFCKECLAHPIVQLSMLAYTDL